MIRFAPSSQPVTPEVRVPKAPSMVAEAVEAPPKLELTAEPAAADRRKTMKPRASKRKEALPAEGTPQLDLTA